MVDNHSDRDRHSSEERRHPPAPPSDIEKEVGSQPAQMKEMPSDFRPGKLPFRKPRAGNHELPPPEDTESSVATIRSEVLQDVKAYFAAIAVPKGAPEGMEPGTVDPYAAVDSSPDTEPTVNESTDVGTNSVAASETVPDEGATEQKPTADEGQRHQQSLDDEDATAQPEPVTFVTPDGLEIPSASFIEEEWFNFDYLEDYEEVERYWVNRPFSYVSVLYHPNTKTYRYQVTEPELDKFEQYVRDDLIRILRNSLMYEELPADEEKESVFRKKAIESIREHAATADPGSVHKLVYYLLRDFLDIGRIDPLMRDANIEDISCDGVDVPVYVYHRNYRDLRTNVRFEEKRLNSLTVRIAQRAGKHISVSNPLVDATLPDGSRIQLTLGRDVSTRGSNFTIRKFADIPYTPIDLIRWNTFSIEQMAYFWLAIQSNKSLIFAGGTGSGKTTSMNAVSFFIPPDSKVVSIEDTREFTLPHENWIQSVTRAGVGSSRTGEVGMYQLLQSSLRQRPEYLLVGEIRVESNVALTFFQAIGTGHTAYTTLHADSIETVLSRLQNPPLSVPTQMIRDLDIVSIQKQLFLENHRVRRNDSVFEMVSGEAGAVDTQQVFERDAETDSYDRTGDSAVLKSIARQRGWSESDLDEALAHREKVLEYLLENEIYAYDDVAAVVHTFMTDPDYIIGQIESDELDPGDIPRVVD